ncbi:polysaccharide deacetylase family protein [Actinoplanes sp. CA-142083]|uniref:polysaccharide deacetylase family protein n=1 Tax=Actinoplanes sp. CA-142083 TaxID=3239903 RepID=UPI003D8BDF3F
MITLNRRRVVLGAVCAGLVALPAVGGWSAERALRTAAPSASPSASVDAAGAPTLDPAATAGPVGFPSGGPSGGLGAPGAGAGPGAVVGSGSVPGAPGNSGTPGGGTLGGGTLGNQGNGGTQEGPGIGGAPGQPGYGGTPGAGLGGTQGPLGYGGVAGGPALDPSLGAPVGWKLSDIPAFPPRPAPEPIVLPDGDQVPYLSRVPVTQPVAFLTMDDGYLKNPEALKLFAAAGIPVTLFLTTEAIQDNVAFFDRLRSYGAVIEAHTISHPELAGKSYGFQRRQICDGTDQLEQWYGRRPVLFRPPFGDKDSTTLRVAKECGIKAAFMWKETVDKGIVRYQEGKSVQRGDIILMHFRPAFVKDFLAALRAIHKAGLTPALLEDYVPLGQGPPQYPGRTPGVQDQV